MATWQSPTPVSCLLPGHRTSHEHSSRIRAVLILNEADWTRLVDQLQDGNCTPFLGAGACAETLPTGRVLSEQWAEEYDYPFVDRTDLARVAQYAAMQLGESVYLKERIAHRFRGTGRPDFADPAEPHGLLARLKLPIFLTTNYDDFMIRALEATTKNPVAAICPWYRGAPGNEDLFTTPRGFAPNSGEPIVYHLHGSVNRPASIVLTEADYLEFLLTLADRGPADTTVLPPAIADALASKSLLFIGYSLQDWTFRVLFHGLLSKLAAVAHRRHVSIQLLDLPAGTSPAMHDRARDYLASYFERWNVSVFWGGTRDFCTELSRRLDP